MTNVDNKVFPSAKLGVEEEFLPSEGTYVENGEVRGSLFGKVFIDKERYKANVIPFQKRKLGIKRYDKVIGEIINVGRSSSRINIKYINNKPIIPDLSAIMHISDTSKEYVSSLDDLYAVGDIIRATVIDAKTIPIQLETKSNDGGVIFTLCEKCGEEVEKVRRDLLECSNCEHIQKRKTAIDYGNVNIVAEF